MSKTISFGLASPKPNFFEQFVECCPHTTDDRVTKFSIGEHNDCSVLVCGCTSCSTDTVQTCVTFGAV